MAVDKLVDSGKLDAALAYEASKIIAKGGGTSPLAFDFANEKGFGDYIDAIPSGGGLLTKLTEVVASADVRSLVVAFPSEWYDYEFLVIKYDLTLSAKDWIYASKNGVSTSSNPYTNTDVTEYRYASSAANNGSVMRVMLPYFIAHIMFVDVAPGESLYLFTYSSSKQILSGSSITVYGGHYADL